MYDPPEDRRSAERKPDEPEAAQALDRLFDYELRKSRTSYLRASRRAEQVAETLVGLDERFLQLTTAIGRLEAPVVVPREVNPSPGELHTLSLVTAGSTDRLSFAAPPYDTTWTTFQPPGASGTQAHGPSVYKPQGSMFIDLIETYVDRQVAEDG